MKPEIKKIWLEALRYGEYSQASGALCKVIDGEKSFCCLGVLTDLYQKAPENANATFIEVETVAVSNFGRVTETEVCYVKPNSDWQASEYVLHGLVQEWAGLDSDSPVIIIDTKDFINIPENERIHFMDSMTKPNASLAELNDNGVEFRAIADYIETYL